ncbi:MAG: hypothetical protein AAFX00_04695, partial [Pseudomonadota bacterium]
MAKRPRRRTTSREGSREVKFQRKLLDHSLSHSEQAREHARTRNRLVLTVMAYAAVLGARDALLPREITEHPARYQNAKGAKRPRRTGTYDPEFAILYSGADADYMRGYALTEGAHFLPCSLSYGSGDISGLGKTRDEVACIRAPFGDVHDLPAIFNDADQRAEDKGLRRAFERCVRKVISL